MLVPPGVAATLSRQDRKLNDTYTETFSASQTQLSNTEVLPELVLPCMLTLNTAAATTTTTAVAAGPDTICCLKQTSSTTDTSKAAWQPYS